MPAIDFGYDQLPAQKYLSSSKAKFKAMFGGFGSGKSEWLAREVLRYSWDESNNYWIIMRRTYPELDDTIWGDFRNILPKELIKKKKKTKRNIQLKNGSWIVGRSFDALSKVFSYNIGGFAIEQAEEIPEAYFLALSSRMRRKGITNIRGLLALNPGGHNWVWRRFIRDTKTNNNRGSIYDYAIAKTEENHHLPDGYVDMLRDIFSKKWVSRYLDCEFDEFEGLIFDKFTDQNIISKIPQHPKHAEIIIVTIDVGVDNPTAVLFSYFDQEKMKLVCFDCIYRSGLVPYQISSLIKAKLNKWSIERVWKYVIDPDALKRQVAGNVKPISILQDFKNNGIPVRKGNNNVDYGLLRTNEFFARNIIQVYNGKKMTPFFDEIYDYIYKPKKGVLEGEINSPGKPLTRRDHLMGCMRYTVLEIPMLWVDKNRSELEQIWMKYFYKRFKTIRRTPGLIKKTRQGKEVEQIHAQFQTPDAGLGARPMGKLVKI